MEHPRYACGVNVALDVVGSKWKPTIVWVLSKGVRRFAELRRETGDVSEKVLAAQLRDLERDGIVARHEFPGFPLRVEYELTPMGSALNDALDSLAEWGAANVDHVVEARTPDAQLESDSTAPRIRAASANLSGLSPA